MRSALKSSFLFFLALTTLTTAPLALASEIVRAGGIGGNVKTGKFYYDDLPDHLAAFLVERDPETKTCSLKNNSVIVKEEPSQKLIIFDCKDRDASYKNLYWNHFKDENNGAYSPNNDAMFTVTHLTNMFTQWYGVPLIVENGKAVPITVYTHMIGDNAYWLGKVNGEWMIYLGDGDDEKYPFSTTGVIAHELAHGFTEQHANLFYKNTQSGGLNESFSDMADQAAQFYDFGHNSWMHNAELMKAEGKALRYLDQPSKDCESDDVPGKTCSADELSQITPDTDVHYSSGIFNRIFYLMATAKGWDTKKAFNVMVKANMDYWTSHVTFVDAACGVLKATQDYQYDLATVQHAFAVVGIDTHVCKIKKALPAAAGRV